jgi:hypothetical protein
VVDSYGLLSVALDRHAAADELGLAPGTEVRLEAVDEEGAADPEGAGGDRPGGVETPVSFGRRPAR